MTTIILTRHGHVDWISPERFRGRAEIPLSELGQRQANALGKRVAQTWRPDAIYTSPLGRCVRTGAEIAQTAGVKPAILDDLADTHYGEWQGLTHDEVRSRWPEEHRIWFDAPDLAAIPGGETLAQVLARGINVLRLVLKKHRHQTVVLVGHDSINRVILTHTLGLPLSRYWRIKQEPCCINEISVDGETFTIHRINESHHLVDVS